MSKKSNFYIQMACIYLDGRRKRTQKAKYRWSKSYVDIEAVYRLNFIFI